MTSTRSGPERIAGRRAPRVVVADDGSIGCYGLVSALSVSEKMETVRIAYLAPRILESVQRILPDVVILPVQGNTTVSLIGHVRDISRESASVLLVGEDPGRAGAPAAEGAAGTIPWCATAEEVELAVAVAATAGAGLIRGRPAPAAAPGVRMSVRELEVMGLAAHGLTNSSAARALSLSEATVKTYWRRIFRKLDVHDRTTAVAAAMSMGLLPGRPPR